MTKKSVDKIFTEIGIGNETFINTEIEYQDGTEERVSGFVKMKFRGLYIRIWIGKTVFALGFPEGFSIKKKPKNKFKFLFGISGFPPRSE